MKEIPLFGKHGEGKVALVSDEDYERVNQYRWYCTVGYAATRIRGKQTTMHRFILGVIDPKVEVDHKDHDKLNNRRSNIRPCTRQQNQRNKSRKRNGTSAYLGVRKTCSGWVAQGNLGSGTVYIGHYREEVDAAHAYDHFAYHNYGEFANLNFPDFDYSSYTPPTRLRNQEGSSQYRGVCWSPKWKKWRVTIAKDCKQMDCGVYVDEIDAAKAYDYHARILHGDRAKLNFPDIDLSGFDPDRCRSKRSKAC